MKKLLYTLLAVSIIFSGCEKEEEEPNNTNNNNNSIDPIVGNWIYFGSEEIATGNFSEYQNGIIGHEFFSNNTFEDYLTDDDGQRYDIATGTWENLGNGMYFLDLFYNSYNSNITLICNDNVIKQVINESPDYYDLLQKDGYEYQVCDDFN